MPRELRRPGHHAPFGNLNLKLQIGDVIERGETPLIETTSASARLVAGDKQGTRDRGECELATGL